MEVLDVSIGLGQGLAGLQVDRLKVRLEPGEILRDHGPEQAIAHGSLFGVSHDACLLAGARTHTVSQSPALGSYQQAMRSTWAE